MKKQEQLETSKQSNLKSNENLTAIVICGTATRQNLHHRRSAIVARIRECVR
jgi:hypothetical protein